MKHILPIIPDQFDFFHLAAKGLRDGSYAAFCARRGGHFLFTDNDELAWWARLGAA